MKRIFAFFLLWIPFLLHSQPMFRSGVFLTHSTGQCIWGPNGSTTSIPIEIQAFNAAHGLSGSQAISMNRESWPLTPWDNEWERWHRIFKGVDPDADIFPIIASNRIVVIKSCYPSSSMSGWGVPSDTLTPTNKTVYNYKWHWRNIVKVMAQHPETFFTIWTNAPLNEGNTNATQAMLSKKFCTWAKDTLSVGLDPEMGAFPPNVFVFNYFAKLTDANGYQMPQYAASQYDSHPNAAATALVAPQFVNEIFMAAMIYEQGANALQVFPEIMTVPAQSGIGVFSVTSFLDWTAQSDVSWCTVTPSGSGNGNLVASFSSNDATSSRTATIIVSANGVESQTVYLVQSAAAAFLVAEPQMMEVPAEAGTASFSVSSNVDWTCQSDAPWCTVTPAGSGNGQILAAYEANTSEEDRMALLSLTGENLATQTLQLVQQGVLTGYEIHQDIQPVLSPNPADDKICITGLTPKGRMLYYEWTNSNGQVVGHGQTTISEYTTIPSGQLKSGMYVLILQTSTSRISSRIVIR